ncbi:MAG: EamA family transporter [Halovenus sp.]
MGAIEINLVSYTTPVFATVFGWLLLNETITPLTLVGFLTISAGFVLLKREAFAQFR